MGSFASCRGRGAALASLVLLLVAVAVPTPSGAAPVDWGREVVETTMQRYPSAAAWPWRYARALYLYGQYLVHRRTGDPRYLAYIRRWGEAHVRLDGTVVEPGGKAVEFHSLDNLMPGRVLAILYRETGEQRYRLAVERMRRQYDTWPRTANGGFWHARGAKGQLWADGAFMSTFFLLEYGRTFPDNGRSRDEAARQLLAYAEHLQDARTGLLYHAYSEPRTAPWADPSTGRSPEIWCRAVGWFGMALVNVLDALPAGHPKRAALIARLQRLAGGLNAYQDPSTGRWYEVMDKGRLAANWLETSCSTMHTFTLARAAERGWLGVAHQQAAADGYRGALNAASLGGGQAEIADIVVGTSVGDLAYYLARPRLTNDFHGLGAFLIMEDQLAR